MDKKSRLVIAVIFCAVAIAGCVRMPAWMFGTFTGRVVEQGTEQPVSGAIVVGLWEEPGFHGTLCVRVESTSTDAAGNYTFPKIRGDNPNRFYVYKRGYIFAEKKDFDPLPKIDNPVNLRTFSGTAKSRLEELSRLYSRTSCLQAAETGTKENDLPLLRAMYEEAKDIAQTPEDQDTVDRLLWGIEAIELGNQVATERSLERLRIRK